MEFKGSIIKLKFYKDVYRLRFDDFYIKQVERKKRENIDLYKKALVEVFGKELTWREFKKSDRDKQIKTMMTLNKKIRLQESIIDVDKMTRSIQLSRGGNGSLQASTKYNCYFCGKEERWNNSAAPNICKNCARKMAENIALFYDDILKD